MGDTILNEEKRQYPPVYLRGSSKNMRMNKTAHGKILKKYTELKNLAR